jgi:membrane protease YdiL (CAAX protease family)
LCARALIIRTIGVEELMRGVSEEHKIFILRRTLMVYVVIFVLWGLYRLLFRFPAFVEELFFKPLVFLPALFSVLLGEGKGWRGLLRAFGFRKGGITLSIYYGLTLGAVYVLAASLGNLVFSREMVIPGFSIEPWRLFSLSGLSLVTAFWEQIVFSGFILLRFMRVFEDEWSSVGLTSLLFTLLHLPILWLDADARLVFIIIQLLLFFLVGFGNAVLMLRTRNILAPILSHTFWALAVGLFG